MRKSIFFLVIFCCFLLMGTPILYATSTMYIWSNTSDTLANTNSLTENTTTVSAEPVDLALESASAILIEQKTRNYII